MVEEAEEDTSPLGKPVVGKAARDHAEQLLNAV